MMTGEMIELRYILRNMENKPTHIERVLQYRQQYDPTPYAAGVESGLSGFSFPPKKIWSEWKDVPTEVAV